MWTNNVFSLLSLTFTFLLIHLLSSLCLHSNESFLIIIFLNLRLFFIIGFADDNFCIFRNKQEFEEFLCYIIVGFLKVSLAHVVDDYFFIQTSTF